MTPLTTATSRLKREKDLLANVVVSPTGATMVPAVVSGRRWSPPPVQQHGSLETSCFNVAFDLDVALFDYSAAISAATLDLLGANISEPIMPDIIHMSESNTIPLPRETRPLEEWRPRLSLGQLKSDAE